MSATLIREFAALDAERLKSAIADLVTLPAQLAERRKQLFRGAALNRRIEELHAGRDEYRRSYDDYIGVADRFRALADTVGSPLATEFEKVAEAVRHQRDELFNRWQTYDDLCEIVIEHIQPSAEQLQRLADKYPPPQSWYDEEFDPFAPEE